MPNKEKSVKTTPKTSGKLGSICNLSNNTNNETADIITADLKRNTANKKKEKVKNKSAKNVNTHNESITTDNDVTENGTNITKSVDTDEIRVVSDELLRRLQLNGTSVSICRPIDLKNEDVTVNQSNSEASNSRNHNVKMIDHLECQPRQKQLNNNNSNKLQNKNNNHNQCQSSQSVNNSSSEDQHAHCNGICTDSSSESTMKSVKTANQSESLNVSTEASNQSSCESTNHQPSTSESVTSSEKDNVISSISPMQSALSIKSIKTDAVEITFKEYESELQMPDIMRVIQRELSEPYSIYTYRYFIHNWPKLCFLAMDGDNCIGAIVCKLDIHRQMTKRGYIAMLAVDAAYRKLKVGTTLVQKAIEVC